MPQVTVNSKGRERGRGWGRIGWRKCTTGRRLAVARPFSTATATANPSWSKFRFVLCLPLSLSSPNRTLLQLCRGEPPTMKYLHQPAESTKINWTSLQRKRHADVIHELGLFWLIHLFFFLSFSVQKELWTSGAAAGTQQEELTYCWYSSSRQTKVFLTWSPENYGHLGRFKKNEEKTNEN